MAHFLLYFRGSWLNWPPIAANGGAIPFNTQFFHDDYDDGPGFDDVFDGGEPGDSIEPGEQDLLAATQGQTRRVRPETVNYAKRAKRVDVRKLKENIWKGLDIVVPPPPDEDEDAMVSCTPRARQSLRASINANFHQDTDSRIATDPSEARQFTSVITDLQKTYPKEKMDEISTSFCFICLLHLANEQGLKLETQNEPTSDTPRQDMSVGRIWDLKVRLLH